MVYIRKPQIIHHFLFTSGRSTIFHKRSHPLCYNLGGDLGGNLGGNLRGTPVTAQTSETRNRSNSRGGGFTQRNDRAKHIALLKLRLRP